MTSAVEPAEHRQGPTTATPQRVFGIDVLGLGAAGGTPSRSGGRTVVIELGSAEDIDRMSRSATATTVLERQTRDGRLVMVVEHVPGLGYRVYAPRNGRHLVSPDGSQVVSALPPIAPWRWQRLLFAQVLPLASTLRGLELLHASAVEWMGRTMALVARTGTGKTSTAAHVVASGGALLTDDVLALERAHGTIVAHSGAPTLSIDAAELERMTPDGRRRLGARLGRADKIMFAAPVAPRANRLDCLYFLERPASGALRIEPLAAEPFRLLSNSFNTYVRTATRVVNQLEIVAHLAETIPAFAVRIPVGAAAADVARAVIAHLERG
jgi:hypothetical protein